MLVLVGPGFLLMQDNARPHVAGVCQQFLQDEGIDAMDWPARSPDLNPIEHIWDIMSRSIHQRHVAPQTVQELADAFSPEFIALEAVLVPPICDSWRVSSTSLDKTFTVLVLATCSFTTGLNHQFSINNNIKFLGIHITSDLTWSMNTAHLVKKAQQRLFFLRKLKCAGLSPQLLTNFYRATTIESILCLSAAVWYGSCTAQDRKDLARVVKTAQGIVGSPLPDLDSIYAGRIQKKARHIAADPTHLLNGLFVLLPSGKQKQCVTSSSMRNHSVSGEDGKSFSTSTYSAQLDSVFMRFHYVLVPWYQLHHSCCCVGRLKYFMRLLFLWHPSVKLYQPEELNIHMKQGNSRGVNLGLTPPYNRAAALIEEEGGRGVSRYRPLPMPHSNVPRSAPLYRGQTCPRLSPGPPTSSSEASRL
ncbi:hypothetical protein L3Q82_000371 [Scortum barcoo]|uniref:Uncharacterized protein n=1 Tax=Scortum barcoo TaxID=214431 RepID=A0ACB8X9W0_9TELE|nr:hypothetical protein L3Q82_000371 [Scortum barcoo]